jgi:hypothetical protein
MRGCESKHSFILPLCNAVPVNTDGKPIVCRKSQPTLLLGYGKSMQIIPVMLGKNLVLSFSALARVQCKQLPIADFCELTCSLTV